MEQLVLIDMVPTGHYMKGLPLWYVEYVFEKLLCIKKTLLYCKENNIHTYNVNYIGRINEAGIIVPEDNNELLYDFDFDYSWNSPTVGCEFDVRTSPWIKESTSEDNPRIIYDKIYYAGASLDQCVLRTRPISMLTGYDTDLMKKTMLLDCCIQDPKPHIDSWKEAGNDFFPDDKNIFWDNKKDMMSYINKIIDVHKIDSIPSLINE